MFFKKYLYLCITKRQKVINIMEISLDYFKELEAKGIAKKSQYGYSVQIPIEGWAKGDFVVITSGENAGSCGYITNILSNRIVFPEDEQKTSYEIFDECSITYFSKVGEPKYYGWKLTDGTIKKIEIEINGQKVSSMEEVNHIIEASCLNAISDMEIKTPYDIEMNYNVEILQEHEV